MPRILLALLLPIFLSSLPLKAQTTARNTLFFEFGGSGGLFSLNYDGIFKEKEASAFSARVGLTSFPVSNNGLFFVVPATANWLYGAGKHKLEAGLGIAPTVGFQVEQVISGFFVRGIPVLGYRYQKPEGGFFFRATYTPLISFIIDFQMQQWAGLSFGWSWKGGKK
ncbi:MAG: hypothetical protein AAF570_04585 [Bacteroidota bacterium]